MNQQSVTLASELYATLRGDADRVEVAACLLALVVLHADDIDMAKAEAQYLLDHYFLGQMSDGKVLH